MKKSIKLLSLLLCLVMAFSLVACGGNDTASSKDDDDDEDVSSTSTVSTESNTESTTASTNSETQSTTQSTEQTTSQPTGNTEANVSIHVYTVMDNRTEIGYVIYHQGETIIAMGEGMSDYPEEGETFSQQTQDDFKADAAEAEKTLNADFAKMTVTVSAEELTYLVVFDFTVAGGMDYYLGLTEIPSDIFYDGVTFSKLNDSFVAEGLKVQQVQ